MEKLVLYLTSDEVIELINTPFFNKELSKKIAQECLNQIEWLEDYLRETYPDSFDD